MKKEPKFTPGPWTNVAPKINGACDNTYRDISAPPGFFNSEDKHGFMVTGFISESNAHLITAAPDLYNALESLLDRIANHPGSLYQAIDLAKEALAKARGEIDQEK